MKLGIVGHGFVGTAVDHGFTKDVQKFIVDPKHNSTNTIEDLIKFKPHATFVAVPTPQLESGECNTAILEDVLQQLNKSKGLLVIVKSTVPSYKLQSMIEQCVDLRIVYNPEFLTEKNYIDDFVNPFMHVFGGINADTDAVEKLYKEHSECKECPVFKTDIVTASMVKYCINGLLATKVTFMNEMYDILKAAKGTDWKTFTDIISKDPRVGKTHMKVPGNDGQRGYAGSCFPKDTNALAWFAREILNTPFTQLETSIKINDTLRKRNQL
jgi:Predicted UDP-glucose 6-dehydrogenase